MSIHRAVCRLARAVQARHSGHRPVCGERGPEQLPARLLASYPTPVAVTRLTSAAGLAPLFARHDDGYGPE